MHPRRAACITLQVLAGDGPLATVFASPHAIVLTTHVQLPEHAIAGHHHVAQELLARASELGNSALAIILARHAPYARTQRARRFSMTDLLGLLAFAQL